MILLFAWGMSWLIPKAIANSVSVQSEALERMAKSHSDLYVSLEKKIEDSTTKLSQHEERFRQLADNLNEVFWMIETANEQFSYISPAYERIWDRSVNELYGKTRIAWNESIHTEDKQRIQEAFDTKSLMGTYDEEYRIRRPDGSIRWVRDRCFPVKDVQGKVYSIAGLTEDITENKMLDTAKSDFVSLASHQLRTPLSTMQWTFEILMESMGNMSDTQQRLLHSAQAAMVRMSETINAMLTASRLQSDAINTQLTVVKVKPLIDKMTETYRHHYEKKHQTVHVDCPTGLSLRSDAKVLTEILSNLLSNAIHYTPENGEIWIAATKVDDVLSLTVRDNGIGIPWDDQGMIFTKLFRAKNAMLIDTNGTGLGLYVTKSLTDLLAGTIFFTSEEGEGTTFNLRLPLDGPSAADTSS